MFLISVDVVEEKSDDNPTSADSLSSASESTDFTFVTEAVEELLRSRRVLSSSYAYGYFLKDCGYNKTIFEYLQV